MKRFLFVFAILWSMCLSAHSQATGLVDLKFGQYQIADSQWNVGACMYTTTCEIYSKNPGTVYKIPWTTGQLAWAAGDYVAFVPTGDATNPFNAIQYSANGTQKAVMGTGHIINMGTDYFFFVGNDNNTGQLFSMTQGFANTSGVTWTGTLNPTVTQVNTYATGGSTTPLAAGQTAAPAAPVKTVTGTSTSYTTRNVVSGNTTTVYRTPVTTTNYSDGTSTNANGTETLYQTRVASTVVTNKIVNGVLTVTTTPIVKVTTSGVTTVESNGNVTSTNQNVLQGLNAQVFRYDPKNYNCFLGVCAWNFTYHTPSTDRNSYGNPVNSYRTTNGMFFATNSNLPNNDTSLIGRNDSTVVRFTGTITAPVTATKPAGTVYRLYFYNNSDDGFKMIINGNTIINQNTTVQLQSIFGTTSNGYMDVVAGQTYNIEAWYWNTYGGLGHTLFWDYGDGRTVITNSAFTTGWITETNTVDTTGFSYSNSSVVDISGSLVTLGPVIEGGTIDLQNGTGTETITSGGSSSAGPTTEQQTRYNTWNNGTQSVNNYLYIEQVSGDFNTVTVTQSGTKNTASIGLSGTGSHTITATQTGTNYLNALVQGDSNTVTSLQTNTSGTNYQETKIMTGNNNTINVSQKDNGNNLMFNTISGNNNSITAVQEGGGNHYLENKLTGNGNSVIANQSGSTANKANIDLTNAGGPASIDIQQGGGKSFTLIQGCANPAGCTTVIRQ